LGAEKELGKAGAIGRFKPLHLGGAVLLETMCEKADHMIIGIGSSNQYNARNPFTAEETKDMIGLVLPGFDNYGIIEVPDLFNEPKWIAQILALYGDLDAFVSGNEYVADLLKDHYRIVHPVEIVAPEKQTKIKATEVRYEMARGTDWERLVPEPVAEYIKQNGLDERFRREFGFETLDRLAGQDYKSPETVAQERAHILEGCENGR
jgi:nicotinamide-nucleotide adenylyltransferase